MPVLLSTFRCCHLRFPSKPSFFSNVSGPTQLIRISRFPSSFPELLSLPSTCAIQAQVPFSRVVTRVLGAFHFIRTNSNFSGTDLQGRNLRLISPRRPCSIDNCCGPSTQSSTVTQLARVKDLASEVFTPHLRTRCRISTFAFPQNYDIPRGKG